MDDVPPLEFTFTRDDYIAWRMEVYGAEPHASDLEAARARSLWALVVLWVATAGWCVLAWRWRQRLMGAESDTVFLLTLICGVGLAGAWLGVLKRRHAISPGALRALIERQADTPTQRLWMGKKRVVLTAQCLVWEATHCEFRIPWSAIGMVHERGSFLEIEVACAEQRYPVPRRVFGTGEEEKRFVEGVEGRRDGMGRVDDRA